MVGLVCVCVCVKEAIAEAFTTLFWATLNLLYSITEYAVHTFNHKTNDAIVSKIDHTF